MTRVLTIVWLSLSSVALVGCGACCPEPKCPPKAAALMSATELTALFKNFDVAKETLEQQSSGVDPEGNPKILSPEVLHGLCDTIWQQNVTDGYCSHVIAPVCPTANATCSLGTQKDAFVACRALIFPLLHDKVPACAPTGVDEAGNLVWGP